MKIKNVRVYALEESLLASGMPHQTGDPIDYDDIEILHEVINLDNDIVRAEKLAKAPGGSGHDNWLAGPKVDFDICYPQYWTPQYQRYNFQKIVSSQSKMHKLTSIKNIGIHCNRFVLDDVINIINRLIEVYNNDSYPWTQSQSTGEDFIIEDKSDCFHYIISNLPLGYELWMRTSLNYLQLKTIYKQRKHHKLKHDWGYFCQWIETLPMSHLITGKEE